MFIEISTLVNVYHGKKNEQSSCSLGWFSYIMKRETGGLVVFLYRWCLCPVPLSTDKSGEDIRVQVGKQAPAMMEGQRRSMPARWETLDHSLLLCFLLGAEPTF